MLSAAQRQNLEAAREAAIMAISLGGDDFVEIMVDAIRNSVMSDAEIEDLGNRIGRIPSERMRA